MSSGRKIILCSASLRRQQLLRGLGFSFDVRNGNVDESFPDDLKEENIALHLAEKKAGWFLKTISPGEILITADTIVWLDDHVLNKPISKEEAVEMLVKLSDRAHIVFTGVCIADGNNKDLFYARSDVTFRKLTPEEIKYYVENYSPLDKAGAYGAQECLPVGMNPCSEQEKKFLKQIGKEELVEQSINRAGNKQAIDMIDRIEGSYFNVMGFPVVEFCEHFENFQRDIQ